MAQRVYTVQRKWQDYNGEVDSSPIEIFATREKAILTYKRIIGDIMLDWEDFEGRDIKFERRLYYFEVYDSNESIYDLVELCEKDLIE